MISLQIIVILLKTKSSNINPIFFQLNLEMRLFDYKPVIILIVFQHQTHTYTISTYVLITILACGERLITFLLFYYYC